MIGLPGRRMERITLELYKIRDRLHYITARQSSLCAPLQAKTGGGGGNRTRVQR